MRTIKFKVWDKNDNVMRFVSRIKWDYPDKLEHVETYALCCLLPREVELLQFTGFLDKNGKEIYEGDILRLTDNRVEEKTQCVCRVIWYWSALGVDISELDDEDGFQPLGCLLPAQIEAEVIGNAWENPELVKP